VEQDGRGGRAAETLALAAGAFEASLRALDEPGPHPLREPADRRESAAEPNAPIVLTVNTRYSLAIIQTRRRDVARLYSSANLAAVAALVATPDR